MLVSNKLVNGLYMNYYCFQQLEIDFFDTDNVECDIVHRFSLKITCVTSH